MAKNSQVEKSKKKKKNNDLAILSKPQQHLQTMNTIYAMFQKDPTKIVGKVALTKYPLLALEMKKKVHKLKKVKANNWEVNHMHTFRPVTKQLQSFKEIKIKL